MTMQLSDEQVETYRCDGVLPLGEVLDTEAVEAAREHLDQLRENEYIDNPSEGSGQGYFPSAGGQQGRSLVHEPGYA